MSQITILFCLIFPRSTRSKFWEAILGIWTDRPDGEDEEPLASLPVDVQVNDNLEIEIQFWLNVNIGMIFKFLKEFIR